MNDPIAQLVPAVYRFALRLSWDPDVAEDITQEVFLRAWRKSGALERSEAARVWLSRIALNVYRDQLRRERVRQTVPLSGEVALPRSNGPGTGAEDAEARTWLSREMDRLPLRQRSVLYLSAIEQMTNQQIATVLGMTTGAVKASLSLARRTLRDRLGAFADRGYRERD